LLIQVMQWRAVTRHVRLSYMQSKPGVWFATGEEIARYLKDAPRARE
jgi:hypothetical protein